MYFRKMFFEKDLRERFFRKIFFRKLDFLIMTWRVLMGVQAKTPRGKLAPFEKTKAVAFQKVIVAMEKHLGKSCWQLTGQGQADFTKSIMS